MKKLLKSKIFWIIIIILVIGGAFYFRSINKKGKIEYVTGKVEKGDITQTVSATGQIKSASEIELNFKNAGKVASLKIKVGEEVKAGQILAQLKANDLAINVNQAQADLDEAKATLEKLKVGATQQDIAVSQATVNKAKSDLTNTEATYSQALENERESIMVDINTALTKANISLQKIYDTLNYKGNANNFSTTNVTLHQKVNDGYDSSLSQVDEAELAYNLAKLDLQDSKIDDATDKTLSALNELATTLDDLADLLDYVIITAVLTQAELDTLKTTINTERTTTDSSLDTVQGAKQDLADARLNYQTKVEEAKKTLAKAQADLDLKQAPARVEDIALYEARVKKAQATLQLALDKYDETILRAPIDGVITDINFEIGEQTSLSTPVITMLATENYEIEVDIPESDIVKIDIGDKAEITLDAFTSDDTFAGVVTTINPAQTEIQDVIYYRVTVTFDHDQPEAVNLLFNKIKPGMTANVTVKTAEVKDVLMIPLRAVKDEGGKKIVQVLQNNQSQSVEVTLGLQVELYVF